MKNIKITIEYRGTRYSGWQRQINAPTVQQEIEKAIQRIAGCSIAVNGSSRTDAGVHAQGMCANFISDIKVPTEKIPLALNAHLPNDIAVIDAQDVPIDFHARYHAKGKKYVYKIYNRNVASPIHRNYCWHIPKELDMDSMQSALMYFEGKHDFGAFKSSGASNSSDIRTIHHIGLSKAEDIISLEISGDGFLYNMVRIIMGTLVDVGRGKIEPEEIERIILSRDRKKASKTAPAHGLILKQVYY